MGVSHYQTGFAMYSSLAVYNEMSVEIGGAIDTVYNNSANFYMPPYITYSEQLFAIQVGRSCSSNSECCLEISTDVLNFLS